MKFPNDSYEIPKWCLWQSESEFNYTTDLSTWVVCAFTLEDSSIFRSFAFRLHYQLSYRPMSKAICKFYVRFIGPQFWMGKLRAEIPASSINYHIRHHFQDHGFFTKILRTCCTMSRELERLLTFIDYLITQLTQRVACNTMKVFVISSLLSRIPSKSTGMQQFHLRKCFAS